MKEVKRIKFEDLKFEDHNIIGGIQARMGNISVIQGDFAYTNQEEDYEVGILKDGNWDVEGHCDEARVEEILNGSGLEDCDTMINKIHKMDAEFAALEYKAAKFKLKAKKIYIGSMIFHGGLACWYFYLASFTDYMSNPAIVGIWVAIAGVNAYFNYKTLN